MEASPNKIEAIPVYQPVIVTREMLLKTVLQSRSSIDKLGISYMGIPMFADSLPHLM